MADSADLVVLGGWYGSGQKGGLISIFLMGCKDPDTGIWYTVSKVHTGQYSTVAYIILSSDFVLLNFIYCYPAILVDTEYAMLIAY